MMTPLRSTPPPLGVLLNPVATWMWFAFRTRDMLFGTPGEKSPEEVAPPVPPAAKQSRPARKKRAVKVSQSGAKRKKSRAKR